MQLHFLGQAYSANRSLIKTVVSEHIACFRGQSYAIRVPTQIVKSQLSVRIRKYRGVSYIVETKAFSSE
ncbi:conserved hypothetical protein [Hyella patelloides LEGE 07179]|uniref:Uncharacterized protein n=1 Tax=Hyella patelloides LEGE 07179 TaxID=945734 RepID=A0A563VWB8_9CYAN|nr:DUF4278 domain-containing protein [Hyella patelloides]VEP15749.1 conserved hypothetical protein [Hyella patelloides LEGE 07179]